MLSEYLKKNTGENLSIIKDLTANKRPVVLFGAGAIGTSVLVNCEQKNITVSCFCDNNPLKWGSKISGYDVISYAQLVDLYPDCNVILTIGTEDRIELETQLRKDGFQHVYSFDPLLFDYDECDSFIRNNIERLEELYQLLEDEQSRQVLIARLTYMICFDASLLAKVQSKSEYFDPYVLHFTAGEYFIDAGALDGHTAIEFARLVPGYSRIVCFEPDHENYLKTIENTRMLSNVRVYPFGLWSEQAALRFSSNGGGSCIHEDGETVIKTVALDQLLKGGPVTFIKMDIEGAESNALKGAEELLKSYKPKLAVCVYHRMEDIFVIPFMLKKLVPQYKIFLRHYSSTLLDTVCYATV